VRRDVLSENVDSIGCSSSSIIDGNEDVYIEALHGMEDLYQRNLLVQYQVNAGVDSNNNNQERSSNNDDDVDDVFADDHDNDDNNNDDDSDDNNERYLNDNGTDDIHASIINMTSSSMISSIDDNRKQVDEAVFLQSYIPTSLNDISNPQEEMLRLQTGQREHLYASTISSMLGASSHHVSTVGVDGTYNDRSNHKKNIGRDNDNSIEDGDDASDDEDSDDDDDDEEDVRYRKVPLPEHELLEMR